ncbi:hypothetical protein BJX99DRAFT_220832 [Aspergillus californicus]
MVFKRLFGIPKAEVPHAVAQEKPVNRISTAFATHGPEVFTSVIVPAKAPSMCSTHSTIEDNSSDSDPGDSDHDSLDSFAEEYSSEFGRRMIEDAAKSPEIRDRVRQVLRQKPELRFSADAVRHAASVWDPEMMTFLLGTQRRKVHLTCRVIEAAVANERFGLGVMEGFQQHGAVIRITSQIVTAAYENKKCGRDILMQLLRSPGVSIGARGIEVVAALFDVEVMRVLLSRSNIPITERALVAAARNWQGKQTLEMLLALKPEVHVVEDIAVAAAENARTGWEIFHFLTESGLEIPATEKIWGAAAGHREYGSEMVSLLLGRQGKVLVSEGIIVAAAGNTGTGKLIIDLLLEHSSQFVLTDAIILAAISNRSYAKELIDIFLDKSTSEIRFTEKIVPSFTKRPDMPWLRPDEFSMCDAIFYILDGKHKDRVTFTDNALVGIMGDSTYDLICALLDRLDGRICITEAMIEAVSETGATAHAAEIVQRLFECTPSVRITDRAVLLACERHFGGKNLLNAFFKHQSNLRATPAAIEAAAAVDLWATDVVKLLLEQTPTVQITERAIAAAGKDIYDTGALDLFLSKCTGEIRLSLQALPYMTAPTINFIRQMLSREHGATVIGPPMEEAVRLDYPEIVALLLKNGERSRTLSIKAAEGAAGNKSAGKEIIQMLLDHGFQIEVNESVVRSSAAISDKGYEIMDLLLRDTQKVRVSQSGMEEIATLLPSNSVRLLFETRDVTITTRMIEGAAGNSIDVLEFLVEALGYLPPITEGVLQAAASKVHTLRWIYCNYAGDVEITQKVVEAAAGDSTAALQTLIEQWGDQINITNKVMEAVAASYSVCDTLRMLFDIRPGELYLSEDFWVAAVGSQYSWHALEALDQLSEYCDCIRVTEGLVTALIKHYDKKDILSKLLRHSKARITASGVQAIARLFDQDSFASMISRHGHYTYITERTMEAAAKNHVHGFEMVEFLISTRDESFLWSVERVIEAAARNARAGRDIIELLLCEFPRSRFATEDVLIAAAGNADQSMGRKIIEFLLDQREDEVVVTTALLDAAIANSLSDNIISELRGVLSN